MSHLQTQIFGNSGQNLRKIKVSKFSVFAQFSMIFLLISKSFVNDQRSAQ